MALDLFDRLRLREPFAQAFGALGFEGEEGWRVAARIKVVLLSEAGIGKVEVPAAKAETSGIVETPLKAAETADASAVKLKPAAVRKKPAVPEAAAVEEVKPTAERGPLSASLWGDPDVRWLTGVHEAQGHSYLVREPYEEMLWWLLMPALLRLAGEAVLDRSAIAEMARKVDEALASAEKASYRIDALLGPAVEADAGKVEIKLRPVKKNQAKPGKTKAKKPKPAV